MNITTAIVIITVATIIGITAMTITKIIVDKHSKE